MKDNLIETIEKFPKYFDYEIEFKINDALATTWQNIIHSSTKTINTGSCSADIAARLPTLFVFSTRKGELEYVRMEFCKDYYLESILMTPEDHGVKVGKWHKIVFSNIEKDMETTVTLDGNLVFRKQLCKFK